LRDRHLPVTPERTASIPRLTIAIRENPRNPRTKTTCLAGQDARAPPASRRLQSMACLLPGRRLPLQRLETGSRKQRYRARLH